MKILDIDRVMMPHKSRNFIEYSFEEKKKPLKRSGEKETHGAEPEARSRLHISVDKQLFRTRV